LSWQTLSANCEAAACVERGACLAKPIALCKTSLAVEQFSTAAHHSSLRRHHVGDFVCEGRTSTPPAGKGERSKQQCG
jgi:hypothetical protein